MNNFINSLKKKTITAVIIGATLTIVIIILLVWIFFVSQNEPPQTRLNKMSQLTLLWAPLSKAINNAVDEQIAFSFSVLNVGQGDSLLIESNTGETLLIDGGPDSTVIQELKDVLPRNDKTIETIILTHPDSDHIAGLLSVIDYYSINRVMVSGLKPIEALSRMFAKKLEDSHIPLIPVDMTDDFTISAHGTNDEAETMNVNILYPFTPIVFSHELANNDSVVARLDYRGHSILTTGDMEEPIEDELIDRYKHGELNVDILKLGHHGSKTSSSAEFIKATTPKIAVASMGKDNSFHHPSPSVVTRIKELGIPFYKTAESGRITFDFFIDGTMKIICASPKSCP